MLKVLSALLIAFAVALPVRAAETEAPRAEGSLEAVLPVNTRYAIYKLGETIPVELTLERPAGASADALLWKVVDHLGKAIAEGRVDVPAVEKWTTRMELPSKVAGYFEFHASLRTSKLTLPRRGSRPEGFLTYGVLPDIQPLPLAHRDDARFGIQGTNFLESGEFMVGDPYYPLYNLLGVTWLNFPRSQAEHEPERPGQFEPRLTAEAMQGTFLQYEVRSNLCLLTNVQGVPAWNLNSPEPVVLKPGTKYSPSHHGQAYGPKDKEAYREYMKKVGAEQVAIRKWRMPGMSRSYYQVQWEPDWHWKGTDEELLELYRLTYEGIKETDPDGVVMGFGCGVTAVSNKMLERLFEKGLGQYMDGIATHAYYLPLGNPFSPGPEGRIRSPDSGRMAEDIREARRLADKYLKPGAKLFQTEWGVDYRGRYLDLTPEVLQRHGAYAARGHIIILGEGCDISFFFYAADYGNLEKRGEDGYGLCFNLTMPNPSFGATNISPKPAFMVGAALTRLLEGTKTIGPMNLHNNIAAYSFDRNGQTVTAVWSTNDEKIRIDVPVGHERVTMYDAMGNASELETPGGIARIESGMYPIYLVAGEPVK